MSLYAFVRQNLGGKPRVGVAYVARIAFRLPPVVSDLILAFIVLVIFMAAIHAAQAGEGRRSPCLVYGQPVPCQNFISSNPNQNRIRDEDLATRIQRDRERDRRRDTNATKD